MHHHRQALLRMRQGDSDRDIAEARIMGRLKGGQWRQLAEVQGWVEPQSLLLDEEAACKAHACSKVNMLRRTYPAKMFRNSLRHKGGAAHSGSRSNSSSAARVNSPGEYRYATMLLSTTITCAPPASQHQCLSL